MGIKELLKNLGYSDEDITKIENGMKENKIYTTSEENMDIRYNKLKEQKEQLEDDLKEANKTLDKVKKDNKDIESLQTEIDGYKTKMIELEAGREKERKEFTVKSKLKDAGCTDVDYMLYKLGDIEKLDIEKELDNKVKELTENNTSFFQTKDAETNKQDPKVIANKLTDGSPTDTNDNIASVFAGALNGNI
ncbi:phage scaffolding protein [Clostridium sp.]|uniref:phage scaffolding protein n=1 Tax=Clostridium sp. TaxID=1506 RepID=UPI00257B1A6E|nr:phage scaffolding protein [Clostridium sp.]MBE6056801.1 scaffolding protein [Clostridium sp.]